MASDEATVTRRMLGKPDKRVDVRRFCSSTRAPARAVLEVELELSDGAPPGPRRSPNAVAAQVGATPNIRPARAHGHRAARHAGRSPSMTTIAHVPKQILISSDLSELRVAVLEEGRASEAYVERRGERFDRREHLQGQGGQRPPRHGGRVHRARPSQERLPPRRRRRCCPAWTRSTRRKKKIDELLQARAGGARPGRQEPDGHQGRPGDDGALDRRPVPGADARRRGRGRLQAPARRRARAAAQAGQAAGAGRRGRDRPHRRRGRDDGGPGARPALPAQDLGADRRRAPRPAKGPAHGVPRGRPLAARHPRRAVAQRRGGDGRLRAPVPADPRVRAHDAAGARRPDQALLRRQADVRALRRRGGDPLARSTGASTCRPAAT